MTGAVVVGRSDAPPGLAVAAGSPSVDAVTKPRLCHATVAATIVPANQRTKSRDLEPTCQVSPIMECRNLKGLISFVPYLVRQVRGR